MAVANALVPALDAKMLSDNRIQALREIIETRLDGMDGAAELLRENIGRRPSDIDRAVDHLRGLHDERFQSVSQQIISLRDSFDKEIRALAEGISKQFVERDVRADQNALGTAKAVDAALLTQKESAGAYNLANNAAINKSEMNTTKLIDGIIALLNSTVKATDEKIADLKGRMDRGEGGTSTGQRNQSTLISVGAVIAAVTIGGIGLLMKSH